ncbi:SRPBCC family protein [Streptomyces sp. SID3343]|uniref:type II toxin-antitoxin system Rv0910 family toxin n=1 Tax=Streptomyces sp. SID3343 TaxID=2690260 RepID=UPI00136A2502|nr:SRPBCC family protein [Streptomyces sp. SID3343]MYW00869.1 SRPBCC family protein [Streptomyces sp. SID3343]
MPVINEQVEVAASPEAVWAKLTDYSVFGEWMVPHVEFPEGAPAKLEAGVAYPEKMKLMGFPADIKWTVTEVEDGKSFSLDGKGPMGVNMTEIFIVEPAGTGSILRIESEVKGGAVQMMAGKVTKATQDALIESLAKFAELVK